MRETKRRVLAIIMTVVLAFSMTSATALSAFADQLVAESPDLEAQASGKIVYDSVYGVFGDYALMFKDVTYSVQYDNGTWGKKEGEVVDVVNSQGQVTIHLTPSEKKSKKAESPGGWSDYSFVMVNGYSADMTAGYVGVRDKSTGKVGAMALDGTLIVSCSYDAIVGGDTWIGGVKMTEAKCSVTFYTVKGKKLKTLAMKKIDSSFSSFKSAWVQKKKTHVRISAENGMGGRFALFAKIGSGVVTKVTEAQFNNAKEADPIDYSQPTLKLKDGTKVLPKGTDVYSEVTESIFVTDDRDKQIKRKGYTLGIAADVGKYMMYNSVKHGGVDIWWAYDSKGKWGAIDSKGNVKVEFKYDAYFDSGRKGERFALVKLGDVWSFIDMKANKLATDLSFAKVKAIDALIYTGKLLKPKPVVTIGSVVLVRGVDYRVIYRNNKNVGTATVIIKGIGDRSGTTKTTFKIKKAANPMKLKSVIKTYAVSKLISAKKTLVGVKLLKKAAGDVVYKNVSKTKVLKKFVVNKTKGTITVPKGTPKGTYKVKIKVTAKGNKNYLSLTKTITCTVKVK